MAMNQTRHWLICYDIADPRRLGRVHRFIQKHTIPVQYSVYLLQATPRKLKNILDELDTLIDPKRDDIRAYPIPTNPEITLIGEPSLPDGIQLAEKDHLGPLLKALGAPAPEN